MRVSERMADPQRSERPRATKLVRVLGLGPPRYAVDHALPERGGEARVLGGRRLQALAPGWREELSLTVYMTAASIDAPHAWVRADETGCTTPSVWPTKVRSEWSGAGSTSARGYSVQSLGRPRPLSLFGRANQALLGSFLTECRTTPR